jgi:fructose-1,6-bisphosphatase/inositol monophosphatase family enzyme
MKHVLQHASSLNSPDLLLALRAAEAAGRIIREGYEQSLEIVEKGVGDLLSEVDKAADEAVTGMIRTEHPNDDILSEELSPDTKESGSGRLWIVDPLDGTAAFLLRCGRHLPSVMIALRTDGHDTLAVVHFPLTGEWFYALRGAGAYKDGTPLSTKHSNTELHAAWIDMNHQGDAARESDAFRTLREKLRSKDGARLVTTAGPQSGLAMRILDGSMKLSAIVHDNSPAAKVAKQAPWDVIPVRIIVEEAGGCILSLRGTDYDPLCPEPFIVAGRREIADQLITLLVS